MEAIILIIRFCHFNKNEELIMTKEYETIVQNPKMIEQILQKLGMACKITVAKTRKYFEIDGFEIVLDNIKELGDFIEIEAKKDFGSVEKNKKACQDLLKKLNIKHKFVKRPGYPRMIYESRR